MKKFLIFLAIAIGAWCAQAKDYRFVYIAHDHTTPTNHLTEQLEEIYNNARDYKDVVIFYLSNANTPVVVKVNTPRDENHADFENVLVSELQNFTSHDVLAGVDAERILAEVARNDFVNEAATPIYDHVNFDFYVGGTFWSLGYNESLIAPLYWSLDIPRYSDDVVEFNVLHSTDDQQEEYASKTPFGQKDVAGINKLLIIPY